MSTFSAADFYDAELALHNARFRDATGVGRSDRILDVGCGAGQTTREAAVAAPDGEALGVDLSVDMIAVARQRSAEAGLQNVTFEQADAQERAFEAARYDVCISRFGVMFFADSARAFANIARAVRPGGRLVWLVWRGYDHNEWAVAIREALSPDVARSGKDAPAFSLGSRSVTGGLLRAAGFGDVNFTEIREPVFYGPDANAAYDAISGLQFVQNAPEDAASATRARDRLRAMMTAHETPEGVFFGSRAWIVSATRSREQTNR